MPNLSGYDQGDFVYTLIAWFEPQGMHQESVDLLVSSLGRREVRESPYHGYMLYWLARASRLNDDKRGALEAFDELRATMPTIEPATTRLALIDLEAQGRALLLVDLGRMPDAKRALSNHSSRLENGVRNTPIDLLDACIEIESSRPSKAVKLLTETLDSKELAAIYRPLVLARLGEALVASGKHDEGLAHLVEAIALGQLSVTVEAHARRVATLVYLDQGRIQEAADMLEPLSHLDLAPLISAGHQAARWRLALESGADPEALDQRLGDLRSAYNSFLAVWQHAPLLEGGIGSFVSNRRRTLIEEIVRAELTQAELKSTVSGTELAFQHVLNAQACGQLARRLNAPKLTVSKLRAKFREDRGGVIVWLPTLTTTMLFVMDREGVTLDFLPKRRMLRKLARSAERAIEDSGTPIGSLEAALEGFTSAILPARVREQIEGWSLVRFDGLELISPTIPSALLRSRTNQWLGCAKPLVTWPSCAVAYALEQRQAISGATSGLLGLLDPDPVPATAGVKAKALPRLPFGKTELTTIRELDGQAKPVTLLTASDATLAEASQGRHRYRWLWIHAHGVLDRSRALPAGLVLPRSKGDRLAVWASDIEQAFSNRRGPDLVLLDVCEAGVGRRRLGDDGGNPLGAAFLITGAEAVILSKHELHHNPTKLLALDFWQRMNEGEQPAVAMQRARLARSEAGTNPREFGALTLIGVSGSTSAPDSSD